MQFNKSIQENVPSCCQHEAEAIDLMPYPDLLLPLNLWVGSSVWYWTRRTSRTASWIHGWLSGKKALPADVSCRFSGCHFEWNKLPDCRSLTDLFHFCSSLREGAASVSFQVLHCYPSSSVLEEHDQGHLRAGAITGIAVLEVTSWEVFGVRQTIVMERTAERMLLVWMLVGIVGFKIVCSSLTCFVITEHDSFETVIIKCGQSDCPGFG